MIDRMRYHPEYWGQLGAWIAYQAALFGRPIRFKNCSYCDNGHELHDDQNGLHHMIDHERRYHIAPGA